MTPEMLKDMIIKFAKVRLADPIINNSLINKKAINLKIINIIDPISSRNNLGKSVSLINSIRIK